MALYICWDNAFILSSWSAMRLLHILFFLVGVQLMINGVFFSSSLLTACGASLICFFILLAVKRPHANGNGHHHTDLGPTYHHIGWMRGKETYFAPLALIALIWGALAYLFLPVEDVYEKTAIVLAGTGLLYLLLATFAHGFRPTIKHILGILFGWLFLLGAAASAAMRWNPLKDWATDLRQQLTGTKLHTGSITTGDVMMTGWDSMMSWDIFQTWNVIEDTGLVDTSLNIPLMGSGDLAISYWQLIPYIANKYQLNADGKPDVTFTYITTDDERYPAFKAAYYNRFFSRSVNPDKMVSCDNYVVFIGLAEQRPLSYTAENVYSVFRNEAQNRWLLYGCKKWSYVKRANLY